MEESFANDINSPLTWTTSLPALQISSILQNVNPSVAQIVNNIETSTPKIVNKDSAASSIDSPILIIDHLLPNGSNSTCIDLTELDDSPCTHKDNDDIIVERHVATARLASGPLTNAAIRRASKMSSSTASAFSSLTLAQRRRKRAIAQACDSVPRDSANATIIIDDDRPDSPVAIKRTRVRVVSTPEKPTTSIQCPICLETLEELKLHKKQLKSTMCGHIMCGPCLQNMKQVGNQTILCPICRTKLTKNKIHDLYL